IVEIIGNNSRRASKDLKKLLVEELLGTLKVHEIEINNDEGQRKGKSIALKAQKALKGSSSKAFKVEESCEKAFEEEGSDEDEISFLSRKIHSIQRQKLNGGYECKKPGHFKYEYPNLEKEKGKDKKKPFFKKKKGLMTTWEDLDLSSFEEEDEEVNKEVNICLMEKKMMKILREGKIEDLSKVNTSKVDEQLQEEVIDTRQSLAKFINRYKNLEKILKHKKHPYDKFGIEYDKKKGFQERKIHFTLLKSRGLDICHMIVETIKKNCSNLPRLTRNYPREFGRYQSWYLDNGCSHHMTRERSMFQDLSSKLGGWITFGGNQKGKIVGIGRIGKHPFPSINMLFVEILKHNILSISQLCENGYDVSFNKGECKVIVVFC
ncbi:hypothetical protein CR513_62276, partial [Mucuna pruriens]